MRPQIARIGHTQRKNGDAPECVRFELTNRRLAQETCNHNVLILLLLVRVPARGKSFLSFAQSGSGQEPPYREASEEQTRLGEEPIYMYHSAATFIGPRF